MQRHIRCISDHPAVMRGRRNVKYRARQQIEVPAVLILYGAMAREHGACVRRVAEPSSGGWGIVDRPFPSRLIGGAAKRDAGNVNDFKPSKRKFANLIRPFERFQQGFRHLTIPCQHRRGSAQTLSSLRNARKPKGGCQTDTGWWVSQTISGVIDPNYCFWHIATELI